VPDDGSKPEAPVKSEGEATQASPRLFEQRDLKDMHCKRCDRDTQHQYNPYHRLWLCIFCFHITWVDGRGPA
jgi:hypothetical protein